jgi:hypothetical protein
MTLLTTIMTAAQLRGEDRIGAGSERTQPRAHNGLMMPDLTIHDLGYVLPIRGSGAADAVTSRGRQLRSRTAVRHVSRLGLLMANLGA